MVTMVATDVPGRMARVEQQFWLTCSADITRIMSQIFRNLAGTPFRQKVRKNSITVYCSSLNVNIMNHHWIVTFSAATKQLYEWYFLSVCLSVRVSVCLSVTPFWLCSHHRIIMKFSGVITTDQGNVHAKDRGQRSKVKGTEVNSQLSRFRSVTPVWIHIWLWNDIYGLMLLRRGALLFFKVIRQSSRSHGAKNRRIWPRLGVSRL